LALLAIAMIGNDAQSRCFPEFPEKFLRQRNAAGSIEGAMDWRTVWPMTPVGSTRISFAIQASSQT
jgi:hypothetical protein